MIWLGLTAQQSAVATFAMAQTAATKQLEPFLTGAGPALWAGAAAFLVIFFFAMIAIIRGRVIKPMARLERDSNFFEPAGADVDISFDDPENDTEPARGKRNKKNRKDKKKKAAVPKEMPHQLDPHFGDLDTRTEDDPAPEKETAKKSRSPFAGLFAKRSDEKASDEDTHDHNGDRGLITTHHHADDHDLADVVVEAEQRDHEQTPVAETAPAFLQNAAPMHDEQDYWETERGMREEREQREQEDRQRAEFEQAEQARQLAIAQAERARAEAEVERQRYEADFAQTEREASFERRKAEAALEQRMQSLATMQRKLDEKAELLSSDAQAIHHRIGVSIDQKFSNLSNELYETLNSVASKIASTNTGLAPQTAFDANAKSAISDIVIREMDKLREAHDAAITRLADRIDNLSASQSTTPGGRDDIKRLNKILAERAAPAAAGIIQLSDLVRSALPAERFAFDRKLHNGASADCMVTPSGTGAPFAIDARYPVDAFEAYARSEESDQDKQQTIYRRAILRHMVFIAEKLIAPPETGDFAIMFLPSDTIFNDLHLNFADIVQDSYRARIWITSPTSLMATLHMMSAAAASFGKESAETRTIADAALYREISALSSRIAQLEDDIARTHEVMSEMPAQTSFETAPPESVEDLAGEPDGTQTFDRNENPWRNEARPAEPDIPAAPAASEIFENARSRDDDLGDLHETEEHPEPARSVRPPFPLR